jgi:hypothetical protein
MRSAKRENWWLAGVYQKQRSTSLFLQYAGAWAAQRRQLFIC